jgi:hypothetical protein
MGHDVRLPLPLVIVWTSCFSESWRGISHGHRYPGAQEDDEEFETRFATIQGAYASAAATNDGGRQVSLISPDDSRPPESYEEQEPTVVLAPHANDVGRANKRGKSGRCETAYIDGFKGINEEHEENIRRFVDSVRVSAVLNYMARDVRGGNQSRRLTEAAQRHLACGSLLPSFWAEKGRSAREVRIFPQK